MDDKHKDLLDAINQLLISDLDSDSQFEDRYQTKEQKFRDREITRLLRTYVDAYADKIEKQKNYRAFLFWGASAIVVVFSLVIICIVLSAVFGSIDIAEMPSAISIITACVTLLTAVIGLVTIIAKYCFPENDEEYITKIVKSIQDNDLENKKENIKSSKETTE